MTAHRPGPTTRPVPFDRAPVERLLTRHRRHRVDFDVEIDGLVLRMSPKVFCPAYTNTSSFLAAHVRVTEGQRILDLCCGSGYQGILAALAGARVVSTDITEHAARCAIHNVARLGLTDRVEVRRGDLYEPVRGDRFDVVIANPPLLPASPTDELEAAVFDDRLTVNRKVLDGLAEHLTADGVLYLLTSDVAARSGLFDLREAAHAAGLSSTEVADKRLPYETYTVWRVRSRS